jgi:hypothetical protein
MDAIVYPVIINHSHEYKDRILPQCVFPLQVERRQDYERRHSDLYLRVEPVIYSDLVGLIYLTVIE